MTAHGAIESRVGSLFDALADDYDAVGVDFFQPIGEGLVSALAPRAGEDWLDMGCGPGAVLLPLARLIDPGRALGIDISPAMTVKAASAAREAGLSNVDVQVGSAQTPELGERRFDGIASSLVLFFLPDPLAALRNWRGLLSDGGRVGVTTFGQTDERWKNVDAVLDPFMPDRDARTSGALGPFGSDAGMERLLQEAGFADVRTVRQLVKVHFTSPDHWMSFSMSIGQRAGWLRIPDDQRAGVKDEAFRRYRDHASSDGSVAFTQEVRHSLAIQPSMP